MRAIVVASLAVIALCACAMQRDQEQAIDFCMGAGFEPEDSDYASCIQENVTRFRQENLRNHLKIANDPTLEVPRKLNFNGPALY